MLRYKTRLGDLADEASLVFMDNNMLRNRNHFYQYRGGRCKDLMGFLQSVNLFRDNHARFISEEFTLAGQLLDVIRNYKNIKTTTLVLDEFKEYLGMMHSNAHHITNNRKSIDKISNKLEKTIKRYDKIYEILLNRILVSNKEVAVFAEILKDRQYHLPRSGEFRKKHLEKYASTADTELVAQAVDKSFCKHRPVIIVSDDLDIINLVLNVGEDFSDLLEGSVNVYSSNHNSDFSNLELRYVASTESRFCEAETENIGLQKIINE